MIPILKGYGTACLLALVVFYICKRLSVMFKAPPGPWGLPLVGYLPFMDLTVQPHRQYSALAKKYGDIFSLQLGEINMIVLNSAELVKEAFFSPDFTDRPENSLVYKAFSNAGQIVPFNNRAWKAGRKLVLKSVATFGPVVTFQMEPAIQKAAGWLCEQFEVKACQNEPVITRELITRATSSVMMSFVTGSDPRPETGKVETTMKDADKGFEWARGAVYAELFPSLSWMFGRYAEFYYNASRPFTTQILKKYQDDPYDGEIRCSTDIIEKKWLEMSEEERQATGMSADEFRRVAVDIYSAGTFTTIDNLEWILLLMATHTSVQERVQQEISNTIGRNAPKIEDQQVMVYTRATVMESIRWVTSVPSGLIHTCLRDVPFRNWIIPKGSHVIANLYGLNHSPEIFENPDDFLPERFITDSNTFDDEMARKVMSFSVGKRRCPGDKMAPSGLFLFFTTIMQRFSVKRNPSKEATDPLEGCAGLIVYTAGKHTLLFNKR